MAHLTLFQDWFVDFGPTRAKMEGLAPYPPIGTVEVCFRTNWWTQNWGRSPEGWKVKQLGKVANAVKGRSYRSSQLADSDTALVTLKSFQRGGGYRRDGLKAYTGDFKPDQVVLPGEVVVACTDVTQVGEVIGRPALVDPSSEFKRLVASLDTIIVRPKSNELDREFLYFTCGTRAFTEHTSAHSTGTTVLHLSKDAIPAFEIILPPTEVMKLFTDMVRPLFDQCFLNQQKVDNLVSNIQRDTLLPKLISGQ